MSVKIRRESFSKRFPSCSMTYNKEDIMKVTDMWKSGQKPTISFELFPARSEKGAESLELTIDKLAELKPDFVSVTFGAGGSTREGSYHLVNKLKNEKHLELVAYFAGYGLSPNTIIEILDDYQAIGVENILVVRGDPPQEEDFKPHSDSFSYTSDLVTFIKPKTNFCMTTAIFSTFWNAVIRTASPYPLYRVSCRYTV